MLSTLLHYSISHGNLQAAPFRLHGSYELECHRTTSSEYKQSLIRSILAVSNPSQRSIILINLLLVCIRKNGHFAAPISPITNLFFGVKNHFVESCLQVIHVNVIPRGILPTNFALHSDRVMHTVLAGKVVVSSRKRKSAGWRGF